MGDKEAPRDVEIPEGYKIEYLTMTDGVQLRCLRYIPENPRGIVFMYPGMNTIVLSWIKILTGLLKENYHVEYVESREKHTSINEDYINITREQMIEDCETSVKLLGLDKEDYIAIGSSLGSTTLIHNLADQRVFPKHAILVGPTYVFKVPLALRMLLPIVTEFTFRRIGLPLIKRIVINLFVNEKADPQQKRKYLLALDLADPIKLKHVLRTWRGNRVADDLPKINGERTICYLIGASEDKLHPDELTKEIADKIENSVFVDLKTNTAAHEQPLIDMILDLN